MNRLVVLYDAGCPMCSRFRTWLVEQPHLVAVTAVPAGLRASLTSTRVPEAVEGNGYADDCDGLGQPV